MGWFRAVGGFVCAAVTVSACVLPLEQPLTPTAQAQSEDGCRTAPVRGFGFDLYGGWKGEQRTATGRFTVQRVGDGFSLFTPLGNMFYASGPTGIDAIGDYIGGTSESPYNDAIIARYGNETAWADETYKRMCRFGMRAMGGWVNDVDVARFAGRLAYAVNVDIYAAMPAVPTDPGSPKPRRDVFVADARDRAERAVRSKTLVTRCASDPWCIGVYVENEAPYAPSFFGAGSHLDVYLTEPAGTAGKVALQKFFMRRYPDVRTFNAVWNTTLSDWSDFQSLTALGPCPASPDWTDDFCVINGPDPQRVDRENFEAEVAGNNARLADSVLAAIEPAMLNLGPRLVIESHSPKVLRAISAPADIVSVNNYDVADAASLILTPELKARYAQLGYLSFEPFRRLRQIAAITRKPIWVSEWFYRVARPEGSRPPILPERPDPRTRADAAARYLDELLAMPFVVGDSWFQWPDQPIEGRADGENQLIGIVDINDNPNEPLVTELSRRYRSAAQRSHTR